MAGVRPVKPAFVPYSVHRDRSTGDAVIVGRDRHGKDFGVGSGVTRQEAEQRLREWVLDSLLASAADAEDGTEGLTEARPRRAAIEFTALDLVPIRLRLLRARQRMSQAEVAARLGMTQQGYAKLERPGVNLQLKTVLMVEAALGQELLQLAAMDRAVIAADEGPDPFVAQMARRVLDRVEW